MADVVLINPPISFQRKGTLGDETWCPPLGLMYLAAVLEREEVDVKIVDVKAEGLDFSHVIDIIGRENPKIIGLSSLTSNIRSTLQLAMRIKQEFVGAHVCLGGHHVSADPFFVDRFPYFDFAILGEGEKIFLRCVKDILNGGQVKGILAANPPMDLDKIPFPARHLIDKSKYREKSCFVITSRGCPYKCIFCSRPAASQIVRFRSAKNVVDEMETCLDECDGNFFFLDDTLTLSRRHIMSICNEILSRKIEAQWVGQTRPDKVDEEMIRLIKKAGCRELAFGVESGNERIRNNIISKNISDKQIRDAIQLCKKYDIVSTVFLMLGFPTETKKELYDTVRCGIDFNADLIGVHPTVPMPGSELFARMVKDGIIAPDIIDRYAMGKLGEGFRGVWPIFVPEGLSQQDIFKARKTAYRKFYLRPRFIAKRLILDVCSLSRLMNDVKTGISLFIHSRTDTSIS